MATIGKKFTWFILYDGSSPDGMGQGRYCGRTTDPAIAAMHLKEIKANPYSIGYIEVITDETKTKLRR